MAAPADVANRQDIEQMAARAEPEMAPAPSGYR